MRVINSDIGNIHITQDGIYCNEEKLQYIDEGQESIVYKYRDKALKLYRKQPRKRVLSEEMIYKLKEIPTKRIIMPEGCLYEKNQIKGLYMPYISGNRKEVYELEKEKLIDEFKYIYDDLSLLGKESIVIDDLRISNFLCNKEAFYLIDTGDYYISRNIKDTTNVNINAFRIFTFSDIIGKAMQDEGLKEMLPFRELLGKIRKEKYQAFKKYEDNVIEYLQENMKEKETLSEYGKRLIRK